MAHQPAPRTTVLSAAALTAAMAAALALLTLGSLPAAHAAGPAALPLAPSAVSWVTTNAPTGPGSLRQAILDANAAPGADQIRFAPEVTGAIVLTDALPALTGSLEVLGPGASTLAVSGAGLYRVFDVAAGATVTITGLTVRDGHAAAPPADGGGIRNRGALTLRGAMIANNLANQYGGGIYNEGFLAVADSSLLGNISSANGGGGIDNYNGTLILANSTIARNRGGWAGGLFLDHSPFTVTNVTLSANEASASGGAGAVFIWTAGGTISSTTIVTNTAALPQRSGVVLDEATLSIGSSVLAQNAGGGNVYLTNGGALNSLGYNLTDSGAGAPFKAATDITGTAPLLGPLQDNGGPAWTQLPLIGSPALDRIPAGANGCGTSITTDQRGLPRPAPAGGSCDIGAAEVQRLCFARIGEDPALASEDAAAVQAAVDAAIPGDTVRLAGTCAGVHSREGVTQTVLISTPLTLRGGYTTTNWATSDPVANPTVLDARGAGRVVLHATGGAAGAALENLTVRNGFSENVGGGIVNVRGALTVSNVILQGNSATLGGGGIRNEQGALTVISSTFTGNAALGVDTAWGGGIASYSGTLAVHNSTFTGNTSAWIGGGIADNGHMTVTGSTFSGNSAARGGGLYAYWGRVAITNTTFSGNSANVAGAGYGGGGIEFSFHQGPTGTLSAAALEAEAGRSGGAPAPGGSAQAVWPSPRAVLMHVTVVSNTALNTATSGIWLKNGPLDIGSSIVANNGVTNNLAVSGGVFASLGYNLTNSGPGTPFNHARDITGTDPGIGPLASNGGRTWTHALLTGSRAIDRVPVGTNACGTTITFDQRGLPRPVGLGCDMGAYESARPFGVYLPVLMRQ